MHFNVPKKVTAMQTIDDHALHPKVVDHLHPPQQNPPDAKAANQAPRMPTQYLIP